MPYGKADLEALLEGASTIVSARGKKTAVFDLMGGTDPADLAKELLGRTGNLRAPAARLGKTWLVGWGEPAWTEILRV